MKKFVLYMTLLFFMVSQTYLALPPIDISARGSFEELGMAEAYYDIIIYRISTPKFVIDHAIDRYVRARDNCSKYQRIYIEKLIGHEFSFEKDSKNPLVKEAIELFDQIKCYFEYNHLMKKDLNLYRKLIDTHINKDEILRLSDPDFIKDKFQ